MIVKIQVGIGRQGKLWTGSKMNQFNGKICRVELVEFLSPTRKASTRRLFVKEVLEETPEGIYIPTLYIGMGGVGSLPTLSVLTSEDKGPQAENIEILTWNWSGRVGGFIVLDPISVESGHITNNALALNKPDDGFTWLMMYFGTTLAEFILLRVGEDGKIDDRHILPIHRRVFSLLAPPEREAKTKKKKGGDDNDSN